MILLPEEQYLQLMESKLPPKMVEEIYTLQQTQRPPDERLKLESEIVHKYSLPKKNQSEQVVIDLIEKAIEKFPKPHRQRSLQLYQHLKQRLMCWNEKGELINTTTQQSLPQTNILDLITFATAHKTLLSTPPKGYALFNQYIQDVNVPLTLLGKTGRQMIQTHQPIQWESFL